MRGGAFAASPVLETEHRQNTPPVPHSARIRERGEREYSSAPAKGAEVSNSGSRGSLYEGARDEFRVGGLNFWNG